MYFDIIWVRPLHFRINGARTVKTLLFFFLYFYSWVKSFTATNPAVETSQLIFGSAVFLFRDDVGYPLHGVVAFVLPHGIHSEDIEYDMLGPFGMSSHIDWQGKHLYGRDTWGSPTIKHILVNPVLAHLYWKYQGQTIVLAGVRKVFGRHVPPLNNPDNFALIMK